MLRDSQNDQRRVVTITSRFVTPLLTLLVFGLIVSSFIKIDSAQAGQVVQRPISDFISTQGTTSMFIPPVPDYIGWTTAAGFQPAYGASVDYAGVANRWLMANGHSSLGTTFRGSISERPLSDGRALVSVELATKNALAFVFDLNSGDFATGTLLFGYRERRILKTIYRFIKGFL